MDFASRPSIQFYKFVFGGCRLVVGCRDALATLQRHKFVFDGYRIVVVRGQIALATVMYRCAKFFYRKGGPAAGNFTTVARPHPPLLAGTS